MDTDKSLIFVVEDEVFALTLTMDNLSDNKKYLVKGFSSAEDCIKQLDEKPKVVVLDYYLNNDNQNAMNGLEALKKISQLLPETKIIMLSGQENLKIADELMDLAFDYVVKDTDAFDILEKVIANALNEYGRI